MRNRMNVGAVALAVSLALTGCGGGVGGGDGASTEDVAEADQPNTNVTSQEAPSGETPNLVGMDAADAEETLRDLNVRIERTEKASPEEAGTVLDQDPLAGDALTDTVEIVVAGEPPAVPDVVGETFADATDLLEEQGFAVEENPVLDDEASDGEVLGQDPDVGTENVKTVILDVARSPVSVPLAEMPVLEENTGMDVEPGAIAGDVYPNSVIVSNYAGQGSFGYNLSRDFRRISGTLGIDDNESTECMATVEFKDGGRTLGEGPYSVAFGEPRPVDFSVADVLRLEITYATRGADDGCRVVFGDFRAEGLEGEVEATPTPTE